MTTLSERDHLAKALAQAQTIFQHDPDFAVVYLNEKRELLAVLDKGDPKLLAMAWGIVTDALRKGRP